MRRRVAALLAVALLTLAACVQGNAGIPAARTRAVATASPNDIVTDSPAKRISSIAAQQ